MGEEEANMEKASCLEEALLPESKEETASDEVKRQLRLAGRLIAGSLLQNLIQMISVMFVGHLGELPLAGASMATAPSPPSPASASCLEWWSFELLVLLTGLLPNPKLETSVLSITLNTANCLFMIPFGLDAAISTRVSNELGAGRPRAARLAMRVATLLASLEGAGAGLRALRLGPRLQRRGGGVAYVANMMLLLAVSNFLDGIQCVLSGVARGCEWQKIGAFYVVGVPAAYFAAFVLHAGGMGLWMGIICGVAVQDLLFVAIASRTDWQKEAKMAQDRVFSSSLPTDLAT